MRLATGNAPIIFGTGNSDLDFSTERMRIASSGNVGIGTTSPAYKLDVNGSSRVQGNLYLNGNIEYNGLVGSDFYISTIQGGGIVYQADQNGHRFQTYLGAWIDRLIITDGGNVGIGTTSPENGWKLDVSGIAAIGGSAGNGRLYISTANTTNGTTYIQARNLSVPTPMSYVASSHNFDTNVKIDTLGTGLVYSNAGVLTSTNPSDERLKNNITDLNYGLNEILKLRPVTYNWKNDTINQGKQFGFIAQEVQEVMPELVKEFETEEGERLGLDKEGIYATLVKAIQEQQKQIEELKTLINK
jgi:hypothetical protein